MHFQLIVDEFSLSLDHIFYRIAWWSGVYAGQHVPKYTHE